MIEITQHTLLYDWNYPAHPPVWLILPSTPSCMIDITQHALKGQKLCKLSGFLKLLPIVLKLLPLQGALFATHKNPGRCPGLRASAPSGRAAYMSFLPFGCATYMGFLAFWVCCLYGLLGLLGVLLIWASCLQGELLILASWPLWRATYMSFKLPNLSFCTIKITQHALLYDWYYPARPERAEALSPGHRPGYNVSQQCAL